MIFVFDFAASDGFAGTRFDRVAPVVIANMLEGAATGSVASFNTAAKFSIRRRELRS
jgi:hypothetical protein